MSLLIMEASHADKAGGDTPSSTQDMELAQEHLNADATATQKTNSQDEQADRDPDFKTTSSPDRALLMPDDNSPREISQGSQEVITESMFSNDQQHEQVLTRHHRNENAGLQIAMNLSSLSRSEIPNTILQSSPVEKNYINEESKEDDRISITEILSPLEKDGKFKIQPSEVLPTEIVLSSAEKSLQLPKNNAPPGLPATALAPSFEPTAAICDGSLSTSRNEMSAEVATILSDHHCDSQLQPNDAGKPHLSGVFSNPQSNVLEGFGHGKDLSLDELVQGSSQSTDDQIPATILQGLLRSNKATPPDESLFAIKEEQEVEFDALQTVGGPIQGERKATEAEFELDSSPIESSSSDTSSDQSSSDDLDDDDDYEMLDPAEQAARLMREDGGSDDEGTGRGNNGAGAGPPRTLNEKPDEVAPKPDLIVTENMKIEELGLVENFVENLVLIKAKTSGEYQVLEYGSVLCLGNRIVIGVVAETLGRVEQPYYAVRFANERAITEAGISRGIKIFYVEQHSTSVFTQSLKNLKGSDASNLHDEEVGEEGIEFSDDEAEAEYKRKVKLTKQAKRDIPGGSKDGYSRGGRQRGSKIQKRPGENHQGQNGTSYIDYDNPEGGDDLYTPLARPPNLHEIMGRGEAPLEDHNLHHRTDRGGRGGRGRGDRGRGRGDRGRGIRGHGGHQGNFNDITTKANEHKNRAQAPGGGGVGQHLRGTDLHSPPPSNNFLPPRPDPPDVTFPYYAAAVQPQIRQPTPAIHRLGLHRAMPPSPFDQSNNNNNNPYSQQPYPKPSFYPPPSPTSHYNHSQSHHPLPQYQHHQTQPQPSQHFPPTPHHHQQQPPMPPYPQYYHPHPHPHSPSASSTPNVPAGTFINPAFFPPPSAQQSTTTSSSPTWPPPQVNNPTHQHQLPASASASASTNPGASSNTPSESERAFQAIDFLRNLSSSGP